MSTVGIGCMNFGWQIDAEGAEAIVAEAIASGLNFFDTSVSYGRGASESMLGAILKKTGQRKNVIIATKFGSAATNDAGDEIGNSRRNILRQCELSLARLQTDYIDLFQMHRDDAATPIEETFEALERLITQGKILRVGVCNLDAERLGVAVHRARAMGSFEVVSHQIRLNLLDRRAETEVLPTARAHGVATFAYAPLAEGFLSGRYRFQKTFPRESRFALASPSNRYAERYTLDVAVRIEALEALAHAHGLTLPRLALAWIGGRPGVDRTLVGASSATQVRDLRALATMSPLNAEIEHSIDEIIGSGVFCV